MKPETPTPKTKAESHLPISHLPLAHFYLGFSVLLEGMSLWSTVKTVTNIPIFKEYNEGKS